MLRPDLLEAPPDSASVTDYDRLHLKLYLRLLDAEADGADWREAVFILFDLDPASDMARAERVYNAHLSRAQWMTRQGYRDLLRDAPP